MERERRQKIALVLATPKNTIKFFNSNQGEGFDSWIYLGKNVKIFSDIEKIIDGKIKRIDIGEDLQETARALRKPYIDFVGSLSRKENSLTWMLSSVSEKNPYLSDFFLSLCYLEITDRSIKKFLRGICIFCEDAALIRTIHKNLERQDGLEVYTFIPFLSTVLKGFCDNRTFFKNKLSFFVFFFLRVLWARAFSMLNISGQKISTGKPVVAIHSWTDQRSFLSDGTFSDAYYGSLEQILDSTDANSLYVIDILFTVSFPGTVMKLSGLKFRWKIFEDFLDFADIVRAWHLANKRKTREITKVFFSEREISDLINEEYARDRCSNRAEQCALYYYAARKMSRQFPVKTFVYTFENHIWERMTIEGIRKSSPPTKIVGYAHSSVKKMELCYSLSAVEKKVIPLPDVILVNGPQAREILLESGFEDTDIQIIGSLRYGNLSFTNKRENTGQKKTILVVLSCETDRSLEMIFKCVKAFSNTGNLSILFKPHPITKPDAMIKSFQILPQMFSFSSTPLNDLFGNADLVIYSDSTAAVEAASRGIPVLHVKSDFTVDMNIFEKLEIIPSVNSPDQIRICSLDILGGNYPSFKEIQTFVGQIFSPVENQKISGIFS